MIAAAKSGTLPQPPPFLLFLSSSGVYIVFSMSVHVTVNSDAEWSEGRKDDTEKGFRRFGESG
jgi:hypothetical protein